MTLTNSLLISATASQFTDDGLNITEFVFDNPYTVPMLVTTIVLAIDGVVVASTWGNNDRCLVVRPNSRVVLAPGSVSVQDNRGLTIESDPCDN